MYIWHRLQLEQRFREKEHIIKDLQLNTETLQQSLTKRDEEIHRIGTLAKQVLVCNTYKKHT